MNRSDIINSLIQKNNYKSYLEIGVDVRTITEFNWDKICVDLKHGVDPNPETEATFKVTSDEFFNSIISQKYDFIFIDGLHIFDQCYKDIINSLNFLNENGTIMVHDTIPVSELSQKPNRQTGQWNGDVWKAIVKLRLSNENIQIHTVDIDEGCTLIKKGKQTLLEPSKHKDIYDYNVFVHDRKRILNLISVEEFKKLYL